MISEVRDGARLTLTLSRPDRANALTGEMLVRIDTILADAAQDSDLRLLVLTGAGEKVFSAGADLDEARGGDLTTSPLWESVSARIGALPCLTIAALNGTLAGGAFSMALACDLRIAVPTARFFYPVLRNGFLPQPSDVERMRALIGPARTRMILLAGQKIDAQDALSWGLIDRIMAPGAMASMIDTLAADALSADAAALVAIKRMTGAALTDSDLRDCFAAVRDGDAEALSRLRNG